MGLYISCFIYYLISGIVIVVGYHRYLTHRTFKLKKWFEFLIVILGLPAGTPIQWVGNHRFHHLHADKELDPHSPVQDGFWFAHNGWLINKKSPLLCFLYALAGPIRMLIDSVNRPITNQQYNHLAKDIQKNSFFRFISKPIPYFVFMILHLTIPFSFMYYFWEGTGIIAIWITLVIIYNLGDSIDSIAHLYGKTTDSKSNARNNLILALLTFGDGWHATHHQYPNSAKLGINKRNVDIGWFCIQFFKKINIASDVKTLKK